MNRQLPLTLAMLVALTACGQKDAENFAPQTPPEASTTTVEDAVTVNGEAAEISDADRERAEKMAKLEFATMEDAYINDPKGQWAISATASSAFQDAGKDDPDSHSSLAPWQATGSPNGDEWNNDHQDIGFDWIELTYDRPVNATEIRAVLIGSEAVEALSKVELIDTEGTTHLAWSGLSDVKRDERGSRTWFVRKLEKTPYQVEKVKVTFANNVSSGYKKVDAVQLVGE